MKDLKIIDIEKIKKDSKDSFGQIYQLYPYKEKYYKLESFNKDSKLFDGGKLCFKINSDNTVLETIYSNEIEVYSQPLMDLYVPKFQKNNNTKKLINKFDIRSKS